MNEIRETEKYSKWHRKLRDPAGRAQINRRVKRLAEGHAGDAKSVGEGVLELRINCGPGYRVYYVQRAMELILLLAGGDKSTQSQDINAAIRLAKSVSEEDV